MTQTAVPLELSAGALRLAVRADLGASIAGLWHRDHPVLRSTEADALLTSRASGCYPLLPYSNRVAWRRFEWLGQPYTTQQNFDDNPHSVHGVGWQRPWSVTVHTDDTLELALEHAGDAHWPFPFSATQQFRLQEGHLAVRLTCTNRAAHVAPVGLGWHPYFPKRSRSRLHVELSGRWDSDEAGLPVRHVAQPGIDADIEHLRYDNCFDGWQGPARLRDEVLAVTLRSSLDRLVVFTPSDRAYYCVEPVSHDSNAINFTEPNAHGLRSVAPGEATEAWMTIDVADVHDA